MTSGQGINVGGIYYEVALDLQKLIDGQRTVDRELRKTSGSLDGFGGRLTAVAGAVAVLAGALARLKIAELSDEIRLLQARVDVAAGSVDKGADAFKRLVILSRETQTSLAGNIDVFNRLNQSIVQMGGNQNDTLKVTELLGKAVKVSGANATEASTAMIQFGQALGSGKLGGDELKSLMESAPYLMRQLADGLGVPIGALKKLGEESKLTADVVVNALAKAADKINADFKKMPQTIAGAMQVARDSAALAALEYDELTGGSRMLAGATKGLSEVLDELAAQFRTANSQASKLGRNEQINDWAEKTRTALSYVADAADFVVRMFKQMGMLIGGTAAALGQLASGELINSAKTVAAMKKDLLDIGNAPYAGAKMRQAWSAGASAGASSAADDPKLSKLKGPVDDDAARKLKAKREAAQGYLQGLISDNSLALAKIDAEEQKALADNLKRQAEDKNNAEIYAKARVEIAKKYARERGLVEEQTRREIADLEVAAALDEAEKIARIRKEEFRRADAAVLLGVKTAEEGERAKVAANIAAAEAYSDLAEKNARARAAAEIAITRDQSKQINLIRDEAIRQAQDGYERGKITFDEMEQAKTDALRQAEEARKTLANQRESAAITTLQYKASSGGATDQEALIRAQAEAALRAVEEARQRDLEASQIYADQKVAIEEDMNRRIQELRDSANMAALSSTADAFGAMVNVLRNSGKEQSTIFKVMFAAQKAFSIASSIVAIQAGIAKAADNPWPVNLAAMASVAAATASIISTITSTNYGGGRQYGGPVNAGRLYRVNETGRPEMFTAANGSQYMLPTKSGSVTPADQVAGGGPAWQIVINNAPPGTSATVNNEARIVEVAVGQAVATVAGQITSNSGQVWSAMRGATNVQGRL